MTEKEIDCSGYNFYCPEDRTYVIFDPQSREENDPLDALLGATDLWKAAIEKSKSEIQAEENIVVPLAELNPLGWVSSTGEVVSVVLQGVIARSDGEGSFRGGWFAVRSRVEAETELHADLEARLSETKAYLKKRWRKSGRRPGSRRAGRPPF
jgi:hypothetical protein